MSDARRTMGRFIIALALLAAASVAPAAAGSPRTLVLALDGVPYRSIERARAAGAFDGWPEAVPLVATFPSVTNVAFTAILEPFGVTAADGYEVQHFDRDRNEVIGGAPVGYADRAFAWRHEFDVTSATLSGKLSNYTRPRKAAWREVDEAEAILFGATGEDLVLAHVGATDALMHLHGDDAIHAFLMELDERLERLRARHVEETGRALRFVLMSDHGNSATKIRKAGGMKRVLRNAGLRPRDRLERAGDVVAPTFGLVGYGALFTRPEDAGAAARAIVRAPHVDVAAWLGDGTTLHVVSRDGEATILWDGARPARRIAYVPGTGDPLQLAAVVDDLRSRNLLDAGGHADDRVWLDATARSSYPDALRRLIDGLTGAFVANHASVLFSLDPGFAWGWGSGHLGAYLRGGRLEGTHGGLDAVSSLAFVMSDDPALLPDGPVAAEGALVRLAPPR